MDNNINCCLAHVGITVSDLDRSINWYETNSFNLDWSTYLHTDKAIKQNYSGFQWDRKQFQSKLAEGKEQLKIIAKHCKSIKPGKYYVYISPSALSEVF